MSVWIERVVRGYVLRSEVRLATPPERLFPFFCDAHNLDRLTPARVRFRILTEGEIRMAEGTLIDYRIRVRGVPVRWRTRISGWDPPRGFTDEQIRGPYRWWVHRHTFEPDVAGGTVARDEVRYGVPGGRVAHGLFVRRDLMHIFEHRSRAMRELFGSVPRPLHRESPGPARGPSGLA